MKSLGRTSAMVRKELRELARRPGAILSLILGPLIVMALFGAGFTGERNTFRAIVVVPAGSELPQDVEYYRQMAGRLVIIADVVGDVSSARARLGHDDIRLLVITPKDIRKHLEAGEQATLEVDWNELDPLEDMAASSAANEVGHALNTFIIKGAAAEGLRFVATAAGQPNPSLRPEVVAEPVRTAGRNLAPVQTGVVAYFGPAVFALILQHLGITLTALSLVRERTSGAMEIFRVAPIRPLELLVAKYVAYAFLSAIIGATVMVLMVRVLGVPFAAAVPNVAGVVALLTVASLGLGLFISLVADTERQAVQLAMLVLLGSVFFSGFVLPVDEFRLPVQALAWLLPVTHGIALLQQLMLRGLIVDAWHVVALAAIAAVLFVASAWQIRHVMRDL